MLTLPLFGADVRREDGDRSSTASEVLEPVAGVGLTRAMASAVAGNVIYSGCQWAVLIVLAKQSAPELVGEFALALAVAGPVILLSQLNLRAVQATDARCDFRFGDYFAVRLLTTAIAFAGVVLGTWLFRGADRFFGIIAFVALAKSFDSIADVIFGHWQKQERLDVASAVYAINGIVSLVGIWLTVKVSSSLVWGAIGFAGGSLVALATAFWLNASVGQAPALRPHWDAPTGWRLVKLAFPLGPVMLLLSLNGNAPRYVVASLLGTADLGVFVAVTSLGLVGTTLMGACGQALSPRLARLHAKGHTARFLRLLGTFMLAAAIFGLAGVLIVVLWGHSILLFVFSPDYANATGVLLIAMTSASLGYVASVLGFGMTATRRFSAQVPLFVLVTLITAIGSVLLIPRFGLLGAAWATAIGAAAQIFGSALIVLDATTPLRGTRITRL